MSDKKKLFVVTVFYEYPVLAVDEFDAIVHASEELKSQGPDVMAVNPIPIRTDGRAVLPLGWEQGDLVYGGDSEITLKEAVEYERLRRRTEEKKELQA